tara:strand:- start:552 stop:1214 length:663 start_codon:yes stop_codon:yes gene_type:complete
MTQKLTILFDLDGTLVDTAPDLMGAHNHVMKKFGYPQKSLGDIKHIAGRGAWIMMQRTFRDEIKDEKLKKEMVKEFINYYAENIDKGSKPIKGVVNFLEWAKSNQILMGVCTNKQERLAIDLLKKINLSQYFEYVAGCDTFEFNKPDPRHLTNVIEIIGGSVNKSIMVGDSEVDSQSAQSAKIPFILVEEGYTEKNVSEIPHKTLIKNFLNFESIVKNYL